MVAGNSRSLSPHGSPGGRLKPEVRVRWGHPGPGAPGRGPPLVSRLLVTASVLQALPRALCRSSPVFASSPLPACLPLSRTLVGFGAPRVIQDTSAPGYRNLPTPAGPPCLSWVPLRLLGQDVDAPHWATIPPLPGGWRCVPSASHVASACCPQWGWPTPGRAVCSQWDESGEVFKSR